MNISMLISANNPWSSVEFPQTNDTSGSTDGIDKEVELTESTLCNSADCSSDYMESILFDLLTELPTVHTNCVAFRIGCALCTNLLCIHIKRSTKPLSPLLAKRVVTLAQTTETEQFLFMSLLPAILLIPNNRQSTLILTLLRTAQPIVQSELLRSLILTKDAWPAETFGVIQSLLNPNLCQSVLHLIQPTQMVDAFERQLSMHNELCRSVQFTNLFLHFLRAYSNQLPQQTWLTVRRIGEQQDNFLRNPVLQLIQSFDDPSNDEPNSPTLTMSLGEKFFTELLDTKMIEKDTFRGERVLNPNPRAIYGGELMAQALVAASKTVRNGFRAHSLHCYFHSPGNVNQPNDYKVVRLRDGRSLSHRLVEAFAIKASEDDEDPAPFFRMDCSFKEPEKDPACFVAAMPNVPSVDTALDINSFVQTLNMDNLSTVSRHRVHQLLLFDSRSPMEMRFCEPESLLGLKSNPGGRLHAWMRVKHAPEPHPVTFLVTLSQSIWFHNPEICPGPEEWILFETRAHYVGDTLTLSYGAMWDKEGHLLASVAQQGLMRTQPLTPVSSATQLAPPQNGSA